MSDQCWINGEPQIGPHALAARAYNRKFPDRPKLICSGKSEMVTGTWMIGSCYKNPNPLYGAYPYGYLERVHAMFPDARRILHVFSGGLTKADACKAAWPDWFCDGGDVTGDEIVEELRHVTNHQMELVDMWGPEEGRYPTWQGDVLALPEDWEGRFDLILADIPYSAEDAKKYNCPPPNRGKIMRALARVAQPGGNLVFLDTTWPMHRKTDWKTWGTIGLVRSTNHRVRLVSMFQRMP